MKRFIFYILSFWFLFTITSCKEQNTPGLEVGYFNIGKVSVSCDNELIPLSRAVDAGLKIEIWQGEDCIHAYEPGAVELSKRIVLPVGEYVLKAYTPNKEEASNEEIGNPIYGIEYPFSIVSEDVTTVFITVPQINIGISVEYANEFKEFFSDYSVEVCSRSGRKVTIIGESTDVYYFNVPDNEGELYYILTATNTDGEVMTSEECAITSAEREKLVAGNYKVLINITP